VFGCFAYNDQPKTKKEQKAKQSNTTEKLATTIKDQQRQRTIPRRKVTIKNDQNSRPNLSENHAKK
jgi:hypothetical protein